MNPLYLTLSILLVRVVMGLRLVFPGWMMIQMGPFSAKGYLESIEGPFANFFRGLADNKVVDYLNKWALFLVGLALTFGIFVRLASYAGILLMVLYWLSKWPHREGIIDERVVYIGVFLTLIMVNAGIWWGFDYLLLQIPPILQFYQSHQWLQWVL
ncbi:MAG: DoxX family protein [Candidatus Colwellbacteria bacterium]|nr:DoxX family protein [Candidatus Colwellbacteria bacterium]